jgi:hypothetical protein
MPKSLNLYNLNVEREIPGVRPILCCITVDTWKISAVPLRYDNELDNELESIPNTEKRSHTCVMCGIQRRVRSHSTWQRSSLKAATPC